MSVQEHIASRMETIKTGFQYGKETASKIENLDELINILGNDTSEFRSIVFEGASMELALKGFASGSMEKWKSYLHKKQEHAAQIFVGLGWAIAQEKITDLSFINDCGDLMTMRTWDGAGYFDAVFRQRQTIKSQNRLEYIPLKEFSSYDQGMGRSLWYIAKGDTAKMSELIALFDASRKNDLWRGIGIACCYVGGSDETILKALLSLAGEHKNQLSIGGRLVAKSRIEANTMTQDVELALKIWNE